MYMYIFLAEEKNIEEKEIFISILYVYTYYEDKLIYKTCTFYKKSSILRITTFL